MKHDLFKKTTRNKIVNSQRSKRNFIPLLTIYISPRICHVMNTCQFKLKFPNVKINAMEKLLCIKSLCIFDRKYLRHYKRLSWLKKTLYSNLENEPYYIYIYIYIYNIYIYMCVCVCVCVCVWLSSRRSLKHVSLNSKNKFYLYNLFKILSSFLISALVSSWNWWTLIRGVFNKNFSKLRFRNRMSFKM